VTTEPRPGFFHEPDPENPGWLTWELSDPTRFNSLLGSMRVREEDGGMVRVRMVPKHIHSNLSDAVHGAVTLALIDVSMFAASRMFGLIDAGSAVTLDLSVHFIGRGRVCEPLDSVVELLRETGRLLFLRGLIVQGEDSIASFAGTIRKPTRQ